MVPLNQEYAFIINLIWESNNYIFIFILLTICLLIINITRTIRGNFTIPTIAS